MGDVVVIATLKSWRVSWIELRERTETEDWMILGGGDIYTNSPTYSIEGKRYA